MKEVWGQDKGVRFRELLNSVVNYCKEYNKKRLIVFTRTVNKNAKRSD